MLEFKLQHFQEKARNSFKKCYNLKSQQLTWVGPMMWVKIHTIVRNPAIFLIRSNILGPKS